MLPSVALGRLVNEYGMSFAGQDKCLECHDGAYGQTVHGRFAKTGLVPAAPSGWTDFQAAGNPPVVGGTNGALFNGGGTYPIGGTWITLGDYAGGAATEYIFWKGGVALPTMPWNLVEGLTAEPGGGYDVGAEAPTKGLYDVTYSCQRCHQLGTTTKTANSTDTAAVPNPTVSIPATYTTAAQWARDEGKTAADFNSDPTVSYPGMSIQCEACHGTGFKSSTNTTKHWGSGTQLSHRVPAGTVASGGVLPITTVSTLGQSQVCGQCHGSYTTVAGTLGIYGYTPNLPLRDFVDINGVSGGASYTYTPTEAEFMAAPTKYFLFPNGSNAKGSHYYYNEWATSGHAYRGALGTTGSPDVLPGGTHGHYNAKTSDLLCARCHTGEGYLTSKSDPLFKNFTPTNANTGFMGQECIACHDSHPSSSFGASNIRSADATGVRSNAGLSSANSSMCEDCHNWELEVMGETAEYKPLVTLATRGGPSHPQREMLHGKVMLEIPVAGEFMPGAKCQDCHMPKTNKSANRFSHGMHIMKPGKAELWNTAAGASYLGEDSCSGCHPGETRSQLQANLDKWQGDTNAALTAAGNAITAAQTRAEYSLTDASKPGYVLVGRAYWNYKAVGSDASVGAHNPVYVVAGLEAAKRMALSVSGSFNGMGASVSILPGNLGFVSGQVLNGDGTGAAGAALTLLDGVNQAGTTVADANGNFSFMVAPSSTTAYRVKWARSSQTITDLYSGYQTITVAQSPHTVTASAIGSGIVTPSGAQTVSYGGSRGFVFTANSGYHVAGVLVDGVSVGTPSLYTFTNVTADHTVVVTFAINTATSLTIAGPSTVTAGRTFLLTGTVAPANSYIQITRYLRNSAGGWDDYGRYNLTARSDGTWSANVSTTRAGSWAFTIRGAGRQAIKYVIAR
jgi:formate-dependent nitrite reductase cytochrome c552 subunit